VKGQGTRFAAEALFAPLVEWQAGQWVGWILVQLAEFHYWLLGLKEASKKMQDASFSTERVKVGGRHWKAG